MPNCNLRSGARRAASGTPPLIVALTTNFRRGRRRRRPNLQISVVGGRHILVMASNLDSQHDNDLYNLAVAPASSGSRSESAVSELGGRAHLVGSCVLQNPAGELLHHPAPRLEESFVVVTLPRHVRLVLAAGGVEEPLRRPVGRALSESNTKPNERASTKSREKTERVECGSERTRRRARDGGPLAGASSRALSAVPCMTSSGQAISPYRFLRLLNAPSDSFAMRHFMLPAARGPARP